MTSSSRESMRRELRELAKLADTMRKDRVADLRSSGEWSALPPDAEEPSQKSSELATPSDVAAQPSLPSYAPVFGNVPDVLAESPRRRRMVTMGLAASALVLGGLVATASMGRSLWKAPVPSGPSAAAAQAPAFLPTAAPVAAETTAPDPVVTRPATHDGAGMATGTDALVAPAANAAPSRHSERAIVAKTTKSSDSTGTVVASKKSAAAGGDSLDEMMRKAVATPSR
jgi:hypothetical protein